MKQVSIKFNCFLFVLFFLYHPIFGQDEEVKYIKIAEDTKGTIIGSNIKYDFFKGEIFESNYDTIKYDKERAIIGKNNIQTNIDVNVASESYTREKDSFVTRKKDKLVFDFSSVGKPISIYDSQNSTRIHLNKNAKLEINKSNLSEDFRVAITGVPSFFYKKSILKENAKNGSSIGNKNLSIENNKSVLSEIKKLDSLKSWMLGGFLTLLLPLILFYFLLRSLGKKNQDQLKKLSKDVGELKVEAVTLNDIKSLKRDKSADSKKHMDKIATLQLQTEKQNELIKKLKEGQILNYVKVANNVSFAGNYKGYQDHLNASLKKIQRFFNELNARNPDSLEAQSLSKFLNKYYASTGLNSKEIIRWQSIINTIADEGVIIDSGVVDEIQTINEETERLQIVKKRYFNDYLKTFVSNTFILLDEFANLDKFIPNNIQDTDLCYKARTTFTEDIQDLIEESKRLLDLEVHYVPLGVDMNKFASKVEAVQDGKIDFSYKNIEKLASETDATTIVQMVSYGMKYLDSDEKTKVKAI